MAANRTTAIVGVGASLAIAVAVLLGGFGFVSSFLSIPAWQESLEKAGVTLTPQAAFFIVNWVFTLLVVLVISVFAFVLLWYWQAFPWQVAEREDSQTAAALRISVANLTQENTQLTEDMRQLRESRSAEPKPAFEIEYDPSKHFTRRDGGITEGRFIIRNRGNDRALRVRTKLESLVPLTKIKEAMPFSTQFNGARLQVVNEEQGFTLNGGDVVEVILFRAMRGQDFMAILGYDISGNRCGLETIVANYEATVIVTAMNAEAAKQTFIISERANGEMFMSAKP